MTSPCQPSPAEAVRSRVARLRAFELLSDVSEEELVEIAYAAKDRVIPASTVLFHQGQVGNHLYLMESGAIRIYREKNDATQFVTVLDSPAVFGEMAIVNPERIRTASVQAISELHVMTIPVNPFLYFLKRFPSVKDKLRRLVTVRCAST